MTQFRKPDLNASRRVKKTSKSDFNNLCEILKKSFPGKYDHVTKHDFHNVIIAHHDNIKEAIIECPEGIELPESLGIIKLMSCPKAKKENINFAESKKAGKKIFHTNINTNSMVGKIYYSNLSLRYYVLNRKLWRFKPGRLFSRLVAKEYPKDWVKYETLHNLDLISRRIMKKKRHIEFIEKGKHDRDIKNYNEFDLN